MSNANAITNGVINLVVASKLIKQDVRNLFKTARITPDVARVLFELPDCYVTTLPFSSVSNQFIVASKWERAFSDLGHVPSPEELESLMQRAERIRVVAAIGNNEFSVTVK